MGKEEDSLATSIWGIHWNKLRWTQYSTTKTHMNFDETKQTAHVNDQSQNPQIILLFALS